ncbi:MAG: glycosyltransferase, partial [Oxalobacteraceae bacterium]
DIRNVLGSERIVVASNMVGIASASAANISVPALEGPIRVVFLSRITSKKNLIGAIDILARVSCPVEFDIHGIIEDTAYWAECQQHIAALPGHVTARYVGEVKPNRVEEVLAPYDLFLFPTLGENYGHVIREALSAGLPVLVSDQTPWRGLVERGAGADLSLENSAAFVRWIEDFHRSSPAQRLIMRAAAQRLGNDPAKAESDLTANRIMLHAAITSGACDRLVHRKTYRA